MVRDAIALKAAVDPILIMESSIVIAVVAVIALIGILDSGLTCAKKSEKGSALSRANAKDCREHVARMLMALQTSRTRMMQARPVEIDFEPVALKNADMKENPLSGARTDFTSPMVKRKVINMINPRPPFRSAVETIHHGTILEASFTSSAKGLH